MMTSKDFIKYIPESVSLKDLVDTWVDIYCDDQYCIVVNNLKDHPNTMKWLGISSQLTNIYNSEVVVCTFEKLEDAKTVFASLCTPEHPYSYFYAKGKFIVDSIDENLTIELDKKNE